jgi:hypothetical protein
VAAHRDDPVRPEPLGGKHREQPDRTVTDHGDRLAGTSLGGNRAEPASAEHV